MTIRSSPFRYAPATLTVQAGDTVVWYNATGTTHTVTSVSGNPLELNSGNIQARTTFSHEFMSPGTYAYMCMIHTTMQGTIEVQP